MAAYGRVLIGAWLCISATTLCLGAAARPVKGITGDRSLPVKSLKYTSIQADRGVWKVDADAVDADGDTEFNLQHRASGSFLHVTFSELHEDTQQTSLEESLQSLVDSLKVESPEVRPVALPKGLSPPAGGGCKALAARAGSRQDAFSTGYIVCISLQQGWWLSTAVVYDGPLNKRQKADIGRLFSSVRVKTDVAVEPVKSQVAQPPAVPDHTAPLQAGRNISIDVRDIDIREFFNIFFYKSAVGLLISPTVSGKISYQAQDKPLDQVLKEILDLYQLSMVRMDTLQPTAVIGRRCELDFMEQELLRLRDNKRFATLDGKASLVFFNIGAGSIADFFSDFSAVKIQIPPTHTDAVLVMNIKDFDVPQTLIVTTALSGLRIQDGASKPAPIIATPVADTCFTGFKRPFIPIPQRLERNHGIKKEFLEHYEAQQLDFKGYIFDPSRPNKKQYEVFVLTPDGYNMRLSFGSAVGENFGKVLAITEAGVEVREYVLDDKLNWLTRMTTWPLFGHPPPEKAAHKH
ncbi:MAG: pilus assembly protein PilP [Pseudomonadota bacterium]